MRKSVALEVARLFPDFWAARLHNPVFIIGCARSGTSLLNDLLDMQKDIAVWSEANNIWDPRGYPWRKSGQETPPIWIDPAAHTNRWWRDTQPRAQEIKAAFGLYQFVRRRPFFLNKTPLNTFRIPYLLQMFPQAKFIHLIRDGRAVVQSYTRKQMIDITNAPEPYARMGYAYTPDELALRLADYWKANLAEVEQQDAALGLQAKNQLLTVTYEALCNDLMGTLATICQYIGVDPQRFDNRLSQIKAVSQNEKWRSAWSEDLTRRICTALEPTLSDYGYT